MRDGIGNSHVADALGHLKVLQLIIYKVDGVLMLMGIQILQCSRERHIIILSGDALGIRQLYKRKQEEDKQEREEQQRKLQIRTDGEDRGHQIDQEWEQIRSSCHKVEACRELGEVYRVNKGNFAVLPESMKHILQNSFLVHGLMNYGYLLLFRVDEKARQFGVGVPGVYYEKEKLVAEMFGFPQFWCDGRSDNGKFGYYLRIVS